MKLRVPTHADIQQARIWRNNCLESLRTSYPLTYEQQEDFYNKVVCDRKANSYYWSIYQEEKDVLGVLIGFGGIQNIEWENSHGEISLIMHPECRGRGLGEEAVNLLLDQGFNYLGLETIWGECYLCSPAIKFWTTLTKKNTWYSTILINRKFWKEQFWNSLYFGVSNVQYNESY